MYAIVNIAMDNNFKHCHEFFCTMFSVVKSHLFIRALLLDRILALEKTTRTPRVHLVILYHTPVSARAYLRGGGGFRGFNPPPEIFRFFLKSEGKAIERKRKKGCCYFLHIFGVDIFSSGEDISRGGLRNFRGG